MAELREADADIAAGRIHDDRVVVRVVTVRHRRDAYA